jgi:GNAT superfamily N-acetyltransferase
MNRDARPSSVKIRKATSSDKGPLLDFIKDVWRGHDYIPGVLDEWLADKGAKMFVIEVDGRQVGMNRMRFLPDGSGWLEGVRIHPDYRGRGLASMLGIHSMKAGVRNGIEVYRLATYNRNKSARRQISKMGFREISRANFYEPEPGGRFREQKGVWRAEERELPEILEMVNGSKECRLGAGVYWDVSAAVRLNPEVLAALIEGGSVFRSEGAVAVARIGSQGGELWNQICFLTGRPDAAARLVKHLLGRKQEVKIGWTVAYLPRGSPLAGTLEGVGMKKTQSLLLFEGRARDLLGKGKR